MPVWTNPSNGTWGDPARWTGGIPDSAGAVADFTVANAGAAVRIVSFADGADFTIGTLNIVTDDNDAWLFRGQVDATSATLRFQGAGGSPAFINVDTNGSSSETAIDSNFGLKLSFVSDVILTTAGSDTFFQIRAPITGAGDLYKFGDGTLRLSGGNTGWTGDLNLLGGRTEISSASAVGNAAIAIDNNAVLAGLGGLTLANRIETGSDDSSGTIAVVTGSTLTLSGLLISTSDSATGLRFGSSLDTGTIVLTGTSLLLGEAGFTIGGGTVRLGNASVAANYFSSFSSTGLLQVSGTLDTNGLAAFIDNLDLDGGTITSGTGALNLTISDTTSVLNSQSGTIGGTAGADRIVVSVASDFTFSATVFTNWNNAADMIMIIGNDAVNTLTGSAQNDLFDGGGGQDVMRGLGGDDIYAVESFGDEVIEASAQGNDQIFTTTSYQLGAGQSVEVLAARDNSATVAMNLLGNELNNILFGNNGANSLDGGAGADALVGYAGDDIYTVDNAGDQVFEGAGGGNDGVYATASFALGGGQSVELLAARENGATTALNLFGNEFANVILGNNGANSLDGGAGADALVGYAGDDIYTVDNAGDQVFEGAGGGNDSVYAAASFALAAGQSVEVLAAQDISLTTALNLTGNDLANTIMGNNGVNLIDGKGGSDALAGFGGADTFAFTTALGAGNVDSIFGFTAGTDRIALDDAVFTAIGAPGALAAGAFVTGTAAADAGDRIIYDPATGRLLYDADGTGAGAAVQFAQLAGGPVLAASDFVVI